MKKIISGLFFRLIKGFEIWAFIALLLIVSLQIHYMLVEFEYDLFSVTHSEEVEEHAYSFSELGVSAHDVYFIYSEPIPERSFDILTKTPNKAVNDGGIFIMALSVNVIFSSILMLIFIPVFFGRIFSDGTIKNLVACGFSKGKIYISSLVFACIIDVAMYFTGLLAFFAICLWAGLAPPVYLPVAAAVIMGMLLLMFTMSAVCIAALFISYSRIICVVAAAVMAFLMSFPVGTYYRTRVADSYEFDDEVFKNEYVQIFKEEGNNVFTEKLDLSCMVIRTYYGDRELMIYTDSNLSQSQRITSLAIAYMDPYQAASILWDNEIQAGILVRDGFMWVNAASNVFWVLLFTGAGLIVFKKREIHG